MLPRARVVDTNGNQARKERIQELTMWLVERLGHSDSIIAEVDLEVARRFQAGLALVSWDVLLRRQLRSLIADEARRRWSTSTLTSNDYADTVLAGRPSLLAPGRRATSAIEVLRSLTPNDKGELHVDEVLHALVTTGMTDKEAQKSILGLIGIGYIYENRLGCLRLAARL